MAGNPLWMLGVDIPTDQKSFFKISKDSKKKLLTCIYTFYVHSPSFVRKKIFFGAYVKKAIFMVQNYYLHNIFLSFLYRT
jgi:hypothetical protein